MNVPGNLWQIKQEVYSMLNESVIKLLKNGMWDLATCANGEPNVVPVAFKDITDDGKLVVGDVFLETTLNNLKANDGKIAISVYDAQSLEGYQIKGTAEYVTEGTIVDWSYVKILRTLKLLAWVSFGLVEM